MVRSLPRNLDNDFAFNVNLKKTLIHKSTYLSGGVKKSDILPWLMFLVEQPLYKYYKITVDWGSFEMNNADTELSQVDIESLQVENTSESELIYAQQQTMFWDEDRCLEIAPGQSSIPLSLLFDEYAEELSFPQIYLGVGRCIKEGVRATPCTHCMSEIRRADRRGAAPHHILYQATKMMRFRVRDGIQNMFRCLKNTERITREMTEDRKFVERMIDTNKVFLKTIPNSIQYWSNRKKDLFAMMRQLGKPTAFLTISANEVNWPDLILTLYKWSSNLKENGVHGAEIFEHLDAYQRAQLVAQDPVICCIHFNKLLSCMLAMLKSKKSWNPFGRYYVKEHFYRIECQHRGSPHAHILLWLNGDPNEEVSEEMPLTVELLTSLCTVDKSSLRDPLMIKNQTHAHTFTCTKRGETSCRFNIPYWPMKETRILLPLAKDDKRRNLFKSKVKECRSKLESNLYESLGDFLVDIDEYVEKH